MPWGVVAAAVIGGVATSQAAKKGADAQKGASSSTIAEQRRQYDQTRQDNLPFLQAGQDALKRQNAFLAGDMSGFQSSPDYAYAQQQMTQGLDRSAAARGRLYSGGYGVDLASHLNGLANQNVNSYWNKLAGMTGQGQSTGNALGQFGANSANAIGNAFTNAGNARASAYAAQGNAWSNVANTAGQAYMYNKQNGGGNSWGWGGV